MTDSVQIHRIEPFRALSAAGAIAGIWREATDNDMDAARMFASGVFPKHVGWPGFRLHIAAIDGSAVGFVYGYRTLPGQWWHDQVRSALTEAGKVQWLEQSMELAEIAVLPAFQGRGIGTRLVQAFLDGVQQPILLAVEGVEERTHALYASFGFEDLLTDFHYEGFPDDRIVVMGRPTPEGLNT